MLKHLNGSLCLQLKRRKLVLDYGKLEWYCGIKSFLSLSNITLLFPLYVRCLSTISKFLQDYLKLALFVLSFDISSGKYLLLYISKIYVQSERKASFYLVQNFQFLISETLDFQFRKKRCSLNIVLPEFSIFIN